MMSTLDATPTDGGRTRLALATAAIVTVALLLAAIPTAAETVPAPEAQDVACTEDLRSGAPFVDVAADAVHAAEISCMWAYGVASGAFADGERVFRPRATVNRQQMASFLVRALDQLPGVVAPLPDPEQQADFADADDISGAHVDSVIRLSEIDVVRGFADGTFRPSGELTRAQMATFLVNAIDEVIGEELDREITFGDVSGTHQASIEKLATIGIVRGRSPGVFAPGDPIERQQMASLLTRTLSYFVEQGLMQPLAVHPGEPGAILGLTDVDAAGREGFDRVTFTVEGDDRQAGWRMRYVDEPRQDGSGNPVEVAGDAFLEVRLVGIGYPFDLPDAVADALWEEGRVSLDGDAIVEIVDASIFEGQQQLFIGTRGLLPFEVNRLSDPQRVYIDVAHTS